MLKWNDNNEAEKANVISAFEQDIEMHMYETKGLCDQVEDC